MIGSVLEHLFSCAHRRITRPITPVSKPGVPTGDTYVVCLDCGKQFAYDWDKMRIGKQIRTSPDTGVLRHDIPAPPSRKLKYALIGSALPLAVLVGNALRRRNDRKTPPQKEGAGQP